MDRGDDVKKWKIRECFCDLFATISKQGMCDFKIPILFWAFKK